MPDTLEEEVDIVRRRVESFEKVMQLPAEKPCFLCSFSLGGKLTDFDVSFSHQGQDSLLAGIQSQIRKVHRIDVYKRQIKSFPVTGISGI